MSEQTGEELEGDQIERSQELSRESHEPTDVTDLFGVPLDRFTAERDALVKRLRVEGKRDDAARVAKLRRPPLTAWALNQAARGNPPLVEEVLAAGAELRSAMEDALGGDASSLRPAQAGERSAVDALVARAVELLGSAGHPASDTARQRMASTVRAAIVDDSVAALLRQGLVDADREAPGFGIDTVSAPRTTPARITPKSTEKADDTRETTGAEDAADAEESRRTRARARRARARLEELEAEADRLEGRAHRLQAVAEEAERLAADARSGAEEAAAAAGAARQVADRWKSDVI